VFRKTPSDLAISFALNPLPRSPAPARAWPSLCPACDPCTCPPSSLRGYLPANTALCSRSNAGRFRLSPVALSVNHRMDFGAMPFPARQRSNLGPLPGIVLAGRADRTYAAIVFALAFTGRTPHCGLGCLSGGNGTCILKTIRPLTPRFPRQTQAKLRTRRAYLIRYFRSGRVPLV
jgi:hypothetical protein